MNRIKNGQLKMRPKWYFVVGTILTFLGLVISITTSIFLVGLIRFVIRAQGLMGGFKIQQMISNFPWWLSVLAIGGLLLGVFLIRKYDFSYKINFKILIAVFILGIVLSGWVIDVMGINEILSQRGPMRDIIQKRILKGRDIGPGMMRQVDLFSKPNTFPRQQ